MKALLAMRGYDKKKHREAWEQGTLRIPQADFKMQAVSQRWRAAATEGDVWNDQDIPVKRCGNLRADRQQGGGDGRDGLILAAIEDAPEAAKEVTRANMPHGSQGRWHAAAGQHGLLSTRAKTPAAMRWH